MALPLFPTKPLKLATGIGFLFAIMGFLFLVYVVAQKLLTHAPNDGWASLMAILLFTQGVVLIILGIVGEYIGRIFDEIKGRPIYIVQETIGFEPKQIDK